MFGNSPLVGVDLSSTSIKLVELSKSGSTYRVDRAVMETFPNPLGDGSRLDIDDLAKMLGSLAKRAKVRAKTAATQLPVSEAIIKIISLPGGLDELEINEQLKIEGGQYIPFNMDAVNFDFAILGSDSRREGYDQVLLVASKREAVEDRVAVLSQGGMNAKIVDVEPFCLFAVYENLTKLRGGKVGKEAVALIDLGAQQTKVNVFQGEQPIYNRGHTFGGDRLTEEIMRRYSLSREDATRMKVRGGLPEDYPDAVLAPFVDTWAMEIQSALDFFHGNMPNVQVDSIVLFGGGAHLPNMQTSVRDRTGVPVMVGQPFAGMERGPGVDPRYMEAEGSAFAVACGLALRRFD